MHGLERHHRVVATRVMWPTLAANMTTGKPPRPCVHNKAQASPSNSQTASAQRLQLVLGIESSCDDTGVAVVRSDGVVLGESLATQAEIHAPWGGVVPNLAMEAHHAAIDRTVEEALTRAGVTADQLDAVAVTVGPGLSLCLRVGVMKALQLSAAHSLPVVNVHHMEAHALVARMVPDASARPTFPFLCLLVSGGHNLLVLVKDVGQYVQLGTTLDDALGEAYDKVARLLGLDLKPSGGAALEAIARSGDPAAFKFAVPMKKYANCDFSYAGLKTSVRLAIEATLGSTDSTREPASSTGSETDVSSASSAPDEASSLQQVKADIAASFQAVATKHLVDRVARAATWVRESDPGVRHLVVAGGVACNQHIRAQLKTVAESAGLTLVLPQPKWCTDNGAMVAWAGLERMRLGLVERPAQGQDATDLADDTHVDLRPRWPLTSIVHERCAAATAASVQGKRPNKYGQKSARKARMHTSLTDITSALRSADSVAQRDACTDSSRHG